MVEASLSELGVVGGYEGALVQFCAEVARVGVRDHVAGVMVSWAQRVMLSRVCSLSSAVVPLVRWRLVVASVQREAGIPRK